MVLYRINSIKSLQKQMQLSTTTQKQVMAEIAKLKKVVRRCSQQTDCFLQYMDQQTGKRKFSFCGIQRISFDQAFDRAFRTCQKIDRAKYFLQCLQVVAQLQAEKDKLQVQIPTEEMLVLIRNQNFTKDWNPCRIVLNFSQQIISAQGKGLRLKMQHYLMRQSNCKYRQAFVLQNCHNNEDPLSVRFSCQESSQFLILKYKVNQLIKRAVRNKLSKNALRPRQKSLRTGMQSLKTGTQLQNSRKSLSTAIVFNQKNSLRQILQQQSIQIKSFQHTGIHQSMVQQKKIRQLDDRKGYQQIRKGVFWNQQAGKMKKIHQFRPGEVDAQWLAITLMDFQFFKIWKPCLFMTTMLGEISAQKSRIFHQIDMYQDNQTYDYVFIRHRFAFESDIYIVDRSVSSKEYGNHEASKRRAKIEYCLWRIRTLPISDVVQLVVQAHISFSSNENVCALLDQQIGMLQNIWMCRRYTKIKGKQCFQVGDASSPGLMASVGTNLKILNSYEGFDQESLDKQFEQEDFDQMSGQRFYSIKKIPYLDEQIDLKGLQVCLFQPPRVQNPLKHRYQLNPQPSNNSLVSFKSGTFFDPAQCVANQKGELVFINQQKIQAQSSVMKSIVKKIGTNLFSGKSILNISLPIQIFANDTNLQRLCRSLAYAPHFLQNKTKSTPIQRISSAFAVGLGISLLYIQMAKPFNPILGQTYQCFIDNCPVYGQQVSHHPPISAVYMVGRGYFIQASLQATIEFGLNKASGTNKGYYQISFHQTDPNKQKVIFYTPPGQISGIIYGQRKLKLNNKIRFLDVQGQTFCEISWGHGKKKTQMEKYEDYFEGQIVKLSQPMTDIAKIKVSSKDERIGIIRGRWNDKVYCNDQLILDINKMPPFKVTDEPNGLPSDSQWRQDRILMSQGKIEAAQSAKEELQEIQRRDRGLRKKFAKNK